MVQFKLYIIVSGTGGRGGSIYVEGCENATLKQICKENPELRFKAGIGTNSG